MKRLTAIFLCILLLASLTLPVYATSSATMTVSGSRSAVYRGDTIDFSVSISTVEDCRSAAFMLVYDSSVFEFVSGKCTLSGSTLASFSGGTGTFAYSEGTTVSGQIFTFTLRVKSNAPVGNATISANVNTRDSAGAIPTSVNSLTIKVQCDHSFGAWTQVDDANHQRACSACGTVEKAAHTWDAGKVTKEATCKEAGEKTYTCTACGHTKTETVAKSDSHSYGSWSKVDDNTHKHTCTICGKEETSAHTFDGGKVTKEPTCMNPGKKTYTCTACGHTKVETVAKTDSHSYGKWEKVDDNTHKHSCTICGKEETASHSWDSVKVTMEPNCKNTGEKTYTCADCGHKKTETLPVTTTHGFGTWTKVDDSTHVHTCADCGKEETAAHAWNKGVVTKSPTCMAEGEKTYTCTGCGHTKTEVVARMNTHTYDHACDTDCNLCGQKRSTSHSYESAWSKDANGHWHKCAICGDKKDAAAHIPGPEATEEAAQTCTACGYLITPALSHEHSYADTWTTDEIGHWYACSGCEEPDSLAAHDFENACDPDCGVCGYTREIPHAYAEHWGSDSEKHWHTCTVCGEIADEETHTPGAEATATTAQTCLVCGYEIAEALGEDTEPPTEAPTPGNPVSGSLWWIIIAAVALCGTGALVMVLKKKK